MSSSSSSSSSSSGSSSSSSNRKRSRAEDKDDEDDQAIANQYRWEQGAGDWDQVREDAQGNIISFTADRARSYRTKQQRITQSIRRGLIRYLLVCLDCSEASANKDYRPCRLETAKNCTKKFIREYFDQNPISQLSICITRDRIAEKMTDLSGNSKIHEQKLSQLMNMEGVASLQNIIELSIKVLKKIPDYGNRELLIVYR